VTDDVTFENLMHGFTYYFRIRCSIHLGVPRQAGMTPARFPRNRL
jgi:hypothetical protein